MSDNKTIELKKGSDGKPVKFGFPHALNLLRLQSEKKRNGWEIVDTKKWQFKDNEISKRPSNRGSQNSEE